MLCNYLNNILSESGIKKAALILPDYLQKRHTTLVDCHLSQIRLNSGFEAFGFDFHLDAARYVLH
jgi:hypothetical protein